MIKIENLTKVYKSKKKSKCVALNNVNLVLPDKGLVFVLGKSGSGKSTLLNLIGGLDDVTQGKIVVDGNDLSAFKEKDYCNYRNNHIGFIFQDYHLIDEMTVYQNVCLSLNLKREEDNDIVSNALKVVGLDGYANRYPGELSGGERQRVAIARAIAKNPRIILADEPTGNLDTNTSEQIVDLLKSLSKSCLILIVSHNKNDAYKYADRIIELSKGEIIQDISKNPEYIDKLTINQNNICYPHDKTLSDEDIEFLNNNVNIGNKKIIKSSNKYTATQPNVCESNKIKIESKKPTIKQEFSLSLKFLKNKVFSIVLSSFMVAVIMVILALSQTIVAFDAGKTIEKEMAKLNQSSLCIEKSLTDEQKRQELPFDCVVEIDDEDIEKFRQNGYEGDIYEVLNITLPVTDQFNYSGIKRNVVTGIYLNETLGTMIVDEQFFVDKIGSFELLAQSDEIRPAGFYITDYVADAIILLNNRYKTYDDMLNKPYYMQMYATSRGYINGIIKTNYKEKYKDLFDEDILVDIENVQQKPEYIDFTNDIYSYLGYSYSFNQNLKKDTTTYTEFDIAYHHNMKIDGRPATATDNKYVFTKTLKEEYAQPLKNNDVTFSYKKYNEIFGTDYTESTLNSFVPHESQIELYKYYDVDFKNKLGTINVKIIGLDTHAGIMRVSEDIFALFNEHSVFTKGLYFDSNKNLDVVLKMGETLSYTPKNIVAESIHTMTKAVDVFVPIFELIALVLCGGVVFILANFSTRMIKDKMHEIGILKALGTQNKSVGMVFGLQICLIALLTVFMSALGYLLFVGLANDVLIASLKEFAPSYVMLDLEFLTFKPGVLGTNVLLIVVLCLLALIIPLRKIKKIKPVKIIKAKE